MTLIELMIVFALIAILAAVVIPKFNDSAGAGLAQGTRANCRIIQELIEIHHARADVPLSAGGYPLTIDTGWFQLGELPTHMWTGQPMRVQVVNGAANAWYPATKTFDASDLAADNAWYNTTNGSFCVLVGAGGSAADTIETFNEVNGSAITALAQTTK